MPGGQTETASLAPATFLSFRGKPDTICDKGSAFTTQSSSGFSVTFEDVAVYFTEEEWDYLQPEQRSLYKEVISDNYQMILSLNRPDIITNIELGYEPYITGPAPRSSRADYRRSEFPETSDSSLQQEKSHDIPERVGIDSVGQLKRKSRYPRVNPLRWLKKYKKSKSRSRRITRRSERVQENYTPGNDSPGADPGDSDTAEVTGDRGEEALNGSQNEEASELGTPQAQNAQMASDQSTQTVCQDSESKPELGSARPVKPNPTLGSARPEKPNPTDQPDNQDGQSNAKTPPKGTGIPKESHSPPFNQETSGSDTSLQRKEKHVKFSDQITTFVFERQVQDCFQEGPADRVKLRSRSPLYANNSNVSPKPRPSPEPKPALNGKTVEVDKANTDKSIPPDMEQQEGGKVTTPGKLEEERHMLRLRNSVKFYKKKGPEGKGSPLQKKTPPSSPKPPSQKQPLSNLENDAPIQANLFSILEEEPKPSVPTSPAPSPGYPADLTLIKCYSCCNCGKTTHWTRLSDQQKSNVEKSIPYTCKMCSRQKEKSPGKVPGSPKLRKATANPDNVTDTPNSPIAKDTKLGEAADPSEKVSGPQNSPLTKLSRLCKAVANKDRVNGPESSALSKFPDKTSSPQNSPQPKSSKLNKAMLSPEDKLNGTQNTTPTRSNKPGKAVLPETPVRKNPYCKLPAEKTDSSPAGKKQKPDKDADWEYMPKSLKISPSHIQTRESSHKKSSSEPQTSPLCRHCSNSCLSEARKPHQKPTSGAETPTKNVSAIHGTKPVNGTQSPDKKSTTTEKKKAMGGLKNGTSGNAEARAEASSGEGAESEKKREVCTKCGKLFMLKRKLKELNGVEHPSPNDGGPRKRVKKTGKAKLPPKEKKKYPKVAKSQLCTKCGKRLVLHVPPEEGSAVGEQECVVLPRKKRKRPLAGMEPFTCEKCGKVFTRHFSLMQHRFIHSGERPYSCKVCGKSFRDSGYLTVHMRTHTNEKPYSCTECGKTFGQHSALAVHQRTHTDERPFQCKDCGKSFTDRSTFRNHQRIHTGEKPYACSYCGKKFTQQPHMKRHESIHTGDRPFRCKECGKRFVDRTKLKKHELIHTRWEN